MTNVNGDLTNVNGELSPRQEEQLRRSYAALHDLARTCVVPSVRAAARTAVAELHSAMDGQALDFDYFTHRWLAPAADAGRSSEVAAEYPDAPWQTVSSSDGTAIAYRCTGSGPLVVLVGGGLNDSRSFAKLVAGLGERFTVVNYDRRGRGRSGDGDRDRYTVDLEVDDLAAVVAAAGGGAPCNAFANCTGGMISVLAAARGVPIARLALFEPPYAVNGGRPGFPPDFQTRLRDLVDGGHSAEAVELFLTEFVGSTEDYVAWLRMHRSWPHLEELAPSLLYDSVIAGRPEAPFETLGSFDFPVLVMAAGQSPPWLRESAEAVAGRIPGGRYLCLDGERRFKPEQGAPILTGFFSAD
nr:DUF6052 family protein [Micromonospora sp. DSM 115978]